MFGDVTEETDAWNSKYYGNINYVAYLVDYLARHGIQGTLEDQEDLEEVMKGNDAKLQKSFEHVVEVMGQ